MSRRDSLLRRSFVLRSDDMGRKVVSGAGYQFAGIALRTVLTIGSTAVLARLLTPADFGYVAMAAVITELAGLLGAFGFANLLIQRKRIARLHLDTVFWASLALGLVMGSFVLLASLGAGWLFADPRVAPLLQVMSLGFVIASLTAVPTVILARQMRFRTEFWINIGAVTLRTAAGIAFALAGWGMWSLVLAGLVGHAAQAGLAFANVPFRPRWRFHASFLTRTWRTSGSYLGNTTLYYLTTQLDLLLIGRQLGAAPLGLYQNARTLTDEIRARIAMPIQHVLFPAFSSLQADGEQFRQLTLRAGRLLAAVVIPVSIGISANAPEVVAILYGDRWLAMTPILTFFGISASLRASTAIASPLFNAKDRVELALKHNVIGATALIACVLVTLPWGIEFVAAGVAAASLYSLVVLRAAFALIGLRTRDVVVTLGPPAAAALAMWACTAALRSSAWVDGTPLRLLVQALVGGLVYAVCLHLISPRYMQDLRLARTFLANRSASKRS